MNAKQKAKALAQAIEPEVRTLLLAMTVAQCERERVDTICRRVLGEQCYYGRQYPKRGAEPEQFRVTQPKDTWLMDDKSFADYHAKMQAIHLANGFEDAAKGFCPALVAEHLQVQAEWAAIKAAEPFFPGVTNDKLLCGTGKADGLETRKKYLDLLIGLVVNSPGFEMSLKGGGRR